MYEDWTPDVQGHGTQRPPDEDFGDRRLRGIRDFVGFRTSWDSELHGIQDFVGPRTSWDLGYGRKTGPFNTTDRNLVLWCTL